MGEYFQDIDSRIMKQKVLSVLKQNYIISTIHKISGELLLISHTKKLQTAQNIEERFVYQKDLERELEYKSNVISQSEADLEYAISKTHTNFKKYINDLNLPQNICKRQFDFLRPETKLDLVYVYYPSLKGSKIIKKSDLIAEEEMNEYEFISR